MRHLKLRFWIDVWKYEWDDESLNINSLLLENLRFYYFKLENANLEIYDTFHTHF